MKNLVVALFICFLGYGAMAQSPINIGVHGGVSTNRFDLRDITEVHDTKDNTGYMIGAFMRFNFGRGYLEPALNYAHRESTAEQRAKLSNKRDEIDLKMNSFEIPVLLGYKLVNLKVVQVRTFIGPMLSIGKLKNLKKLGNQNEDPDKANWRFKVGAGVDVWKLTFDVDYEKAFKKLSHEVKAPRSFNFTVGLKLI